MKTTRARSRLRSSTKRCFRRSRTIRRLHGRASTSRSSTSPSFLHVLRHSPSSATSRSTSASRTEDSSRTSSARNSTSSDVRCMCSSDRNRKHTAFPECRIICSQGTPESQSGANRLGLCAARHAPDTQHDTKTTCRHWGARVFCIVLVVNALLGSSYVKIYGSIA